MSDSFFIKVPCKIFDLGLDAFDIAVFLALIKHGKSIFPGYKRLRTMTGNICKERVWKSLNNLKDCNMIQWERGMIGKSNRYFILGCGCWTKKKNVDNSKRRFVKRTMGGPLNEPGPVRQTNPNYIKGNRSIELGKPDFIQLVKGLQK